MTSTENEPRSTKSPAGWRELGRSEAGKTSGRTVEQVAIVLARQAVELEDIHQVVPLAVHVPAHRHMCPFPHLHIHQRGQAQQLRLHLQQDGEGVAAVQHPALAEVHNHLLHKFQRHPVVFLQPRAGVVRGNGWAARERMREAESWAPPNAPTSERSMLSLTIFWECGTRERRRGHNGHPLRTSSSSGLAMAAGRTVRPDCTASALAAPHLQTSPPAQPSRTPSLSRWRPCQSGEVSTPAVWCSERERWDAAAWTRAARLLVVFQSLRVSAQQKACSGTSVVSLWVPELVRARRAGGPAAARAFV
jgi:hypothetical protein